MNRGDILEQYTESEYWFGMVPELKAARELPHLQLERNQMNNFHNRYTGQLVLHVLLAKYGEGHAPLFSVNDRIFDLVKNIYENFYELGREINTSFSPYQAMPVINEPTLPTCVILALDDISNVSPYYQPIHSFSNQGIVDVLSCYKNQNGRVEGNIQGIFILDWLDQYIRNINPDNHYRSQDGGLFAAQINEGSDQIPVRNYQAPVRKLRYLDFQISCYYNLKPGPLINKIQDEFNLNVLDPEPQFIRAWQTLKNLSPVLSRNFYALNVPNSFYNSIIDFRPRIVDRADSNEPSDSDNSESGGEDDVENKRQLLRDRETQPTIDAIVDDLLSRYDGVLLRDVTIRDLRKTINELAPILENNYPGVFDDSLKEVRYVLNENGAAFLQNTTVLRGQYKIKALRLVREFLKAVRIQVNAHVESIGTWLLNVLPPVPDRLTRDTLRNNFITSTAAIIQAARPDPTAPFNHDS